MNCLTRCIKFVFVTVVVWKRSDLLALSGGFELSGPFQQLVDSDLCAIGNCLLQLVPVFARTLCCRLYHLLQLQVFQFENSHKRPNVSWKNIAESALHIAIRVGSVSELFHVFATDRRIL